MGFPRQEYWSRLSFPPPNLPDPGITPGSLMSPALVYILSHFHGVWLSETLWTVARQASLSMGFSKKEYWSGLPCPPPGDLPNPRIKPASPLSPPLAGGFFITAAAKSLQSCPTLCDPIDGSPPGYPIPGILQARTLEWVAISFSSAWKWKVKVKSLSRVRLAPPYYWYGIQV